jgi:hypothetical protein
MFTVAFTAVGLPSGSGWSVNLDSQTQTSTSETIVFSVRNGIHAFRIVPPAGCSTSPLSGTVTVVSADVGREVTFAVSSSTLSPVILALSIILLLALALLAAVVNRKKSNSRKGLQIPT